MDQKENLPSQGINCMAMACCQKDELAKYEVDNTRAFEKLSRKRSFENSILKSRKDSEARFSQIFNIDEGTNGTENLVFSSDEEGDNQNAKNTHGDEKLDVFSEGQRREKRDALFTYQTNRSKANSVFSASKSKNTALQMLDAKSMCFNNRNHQIMDGSQEESKDKKAANNKEVNLAEP